MRKAIVKFILVFAVWGLVVMGQWWEAVAMLLLGITFLSLPESKPKKQKTLRVIQTPIIPKMEQEKATNLLKDLALSLELAPYLTEDDYAVLHSMKESLKRKTRQLTEAKNTVTILEEQLKSTQKVIKTIGEMTWERKSKDAEDRRISQ